MGLDMYLFEEMGDHTTELMYWRKEWDIQRIIGEVLGVKIENCTEYPITWEELEQIRDEICDMSYGYWIAKEEFNYVQKGISKLDEILDTYPKDHVFCYYAWW